jgi:hypothetical protein
MEARIFSTSADGVILADRLIRPESTTGMKVDGTQTLRCATARMTFGPDGAEVTVENHLDDPLEQSVLYVNGQTFALGDIEPTATASFTATDADRLGDGEFTSGMVPNQRRNRLLRRMLPEATPLQEVDNTPMFIGYTPRGPSDPLGQTDLHRQGWSVVLTRAEWEAPASGTAITVPEGFCDLELHRLRSTFYDIIRNRFHATNQSGSLGIIVSMPQGIASLDSAEVRIVVDIRAAGWRASLSGAKDFQNHKAVGTTLVEAVENPPERVEFQIPDATRFRDADGRYLFVLNLEPLDPTVPSTQRPFWQINSIKASLKGTTE